MEEVLGEMMKSAILRTVYQAIFWAALWAGILAGSSTPAAELEETRVCGGHPEDARIAKEYRAALGSYLKLYRTYSSGKNTSSEVHGAIAADYPVILSELVLGAATRGCYEALLSDLDRRYDRDPEAIAWLGRAIQTDWEMNFLPAYSGIHESDLATKRLLFNTGVVGGSLLFLRATNPKLATLNYFSMLRGAMAVPKVAAGGVVVHQLGSSSHRSDVPAAAWIAPATKLRFGTAPLLEKGVMDTQSAQFQQEMISQLAGLTAGFSTYAATSRLMGHVATQVPLTGHVGLAAKLGIYASAVVISLAVDQVVEHQTGVSLREMDRKALQDELKVAAHAVSLLIRQGSKASDQKVYRAADQLIQAVLRVDARQNLKLLESIFSFEKDIVRIEGERDMASRVEEFYSTKAKEFKKLYPGFDPMVVRYVGRRELKSLPNLTRAQVGARIAEVRKAEKNEFMKSQRLLLEQFQASRIERLHDFLAAAERAEEAYFVQEAASAGMSERGERMLIQAFSMLKALKREMLKKTAEETLLVKLSAYTALATTQNLPGRNGSALFGGSR